MPDDPDPEPSSSDSLSNKKKRNKKKKRRKHRRDVLSDPPSSDNSDSCDNSDYRRKRRKEKSHWKNDLIKLCARLTEFFLKTESKSNIIRLKMDEDPLQRQIYFLTFVESLEMIFSQHTETCEVIIDYPKIGGDDIKDYSKKDKRNILQKNIDVHSRRLISEFPMDGIKCIEKLQSHCANMTFSDKSRYDRTFQKVTYKEGKSATN